MVFFSLLILLFGFSKHERDLIAYSKSESLFPDWDWYVENRYTTKSFWLKNVFPFLDGWHFWEGVNVMCASLLTTGALQISVWWGFLIYAIIGAVHSALDGSLFRWK